MSGFLDLEQMGGFLYFIFLFISTVDMWMRRFLSKDTFVDGTRAKIPKDYSGRRPGLTRQRAIFFRLIFTVAVWRERNSHTTNLWNPPCVSS